MKLPVEWITEYAGTGPEVTPDEIAHRLTMAGLEVEETAESARGPVLDIKVTPNRGDCLSVVGVARELSAAYRTELKPVEREVASGPGDAAALSSVIVDAPDLCPRYAARIIRSVVARSAPAWMRERLEAAGMRSIGGIVDVTNYVMLETGQPLHAFDLDKLAGRQIVVRRARADEVLTTLDGVDRALSPEMLVIADAERPVAIAGVMGGADTEMSVQTQTVLLESAHFDWLSVRRTARALQMRTEASDRFSRVVDPEAVALAADRACTLIQELGLGEVVPGILNVHPDPRPQRTLTVRPERATMLLGFPVSATDAADALTRLGFIVTVNDHPSTISLSVPSWRPDIVREVDLVEEVGRVLGYENIPERLPVGTGRGGDSPSARFAARIREALVSAGLHEVVTHTLLAPTPLEDARDAACRIGIRSALSAELSGLRRSLLPGLVEAVDRNARRDQSPLAFFELGKVFHCAQGEYRETMEVSAAVAGPLAPPDWDHLASEHAPAGYHLARGIVEHLTASLGIGPIVCRGMQGDARLHPGRSADIWAGDERLGFVGELHPALSADLVTRERVVVFTIDVDALIRMSDQLHAFQPLAQYPSVERDLAPRVAESIPYGQLAEAVRGAGVDILKSFRLIDVYAGAPLPSGHKSLTISLTFRAQDRTLTDTEVNDALAVLRAALESTCEATFPA